MPRDEDEIDFVVGEPAAGVPDDHISRAPRRLRIIVVIGVLTLLVVALALRASLKSDGHPRANGTPVASPSVPSLQPAPDLGTKVAPPVVVEVPDLPSSVPTRRGDDPRACPGHRCRTAVLVPAAVTAAVQQAIPESEVETVETVRLRGRHHVLWFRMIEARVASESLQVTVAAPARGDRSGVTVGRSGVVATTTVATTLGPWHVTVELIDPTGGQGDVVTMSRLARDPRIAAG